MKVGERMGTIVVIGGGELIDLETLEMDREVVELTRKAKPKALFIPTATVMLLQVIVIRSTKCTARF